MNPDTHEARDLKIPRIVDSTELTATSRFCVFYSALMEY